ncbi:MAG: MaoC family dehydratase [Pseudomonadota bacterium]
MKYLEDFQPGQIYRFRAEPLSKEEIIAFAQEWDPQRLHTDEAYATGIHGSLIASGFQTLLQVFKPVMRNMMTDVANIGGLGFDSLKWLRPVRPGEALDVELEVSSVTPSKTKPDRGVMTYTLRAMNPAGQVVFTVDTGAMVKRRPSPEK